MAPPLCNEKRVARQVSVCAARGAEEERFRVKRRQHRHSVGPELLEEVREHPRGRAVSVCTREERELVLDVDGIGGTAAFSDLVPPRHHLACSEISEFPPVDRENVDLDTSIPKGRDELPGITSDTAVRLPGGDQGNAHT